MIFFAFSPNPRRRQLFALLAGLCGYAWAFQPVGASTPADTDAVVEAVRLGDVDRLRLLLKEGASATGQPPGRWSHPPLFHALKTRQFDSARVLIEAGARVRLPVDEGVPLIWAAQAGDAGILRLMLQRGARADESPSSYLGHDLSAMAAAVNWGRLEVIKELENAGVSVLGDDQGALALRVAGLGGYTDCAGHVLARGARVDVRHEGNTALDGAILQNNLEVIKLLLDRGADVNGVSDGPPIRGWEGYRRTPVVMAVLTSQHEALELLLQRGADVRALDNLAIKLADLMGDEVAWRRLKAAGAPEPGAFAFRDWADGEFLGKAAGIPARSPTGTAGHAGWGATWVGSMSGAMSVEKGAGLGQPTRFAVIPLDKGLADVEGLLVARLSRVEKAVVLERSELDALRKERLVAGNFTGSSGTGREIGKMLGADALVFLQTYRIGENQVVEARIVSVATGLVTAVVPWVREKAGLEAWAQALAMRCAAEGGRIHASPREVRLVAVSPFTASLNTGAAREAERQLTVAITLRLARMPGVFLVEREVLERLRMENQSEGNALLSGSWLISGSVETSLNDDGVVLRLKASPSPGGKAGGRELQVQGRAGDPAGMAESAGRELAPMFAADTDVRWAPLAEAEHLLAQGQAFLARRMWEQADAAGEAAWVLGLRDDRARRLRVETIAGRLGFYGDLLPGVKRSRLKLRGSREMLSFRAPLLLPADGPDEPTAADYVEQANILLDLFEPTLDETREEVAGRSFADWAGGPVWDAATVPLRLAQPLSYRREGLPLKELGRRLIAASDRALALARKRNDAVLWHLLAALRCKHLAWWAQEDEAFFQSDVLRVLAEARAAQPPYSQHAVWEPVHAFAAEHMARLNGSKGQSWVRLARRMARSSDAGEAFFGVALLNKEVQGLRTIESQRDWMMATFPVLVEQDRAVPVLARLPGYATGSLRGGYYVKGCWYEDVLRTQLNRPGVNPEDDGLVLITGERRYQQGPEVREFYRANLQRRLEVIAERGASGVFAPFARDNGLMIDELDRLIAQTERAHARFVADAQENPGIRAAEKAWTSLLSTSSLQAERKHLLATAPTQPDGTLTLGPQRVLFEAEMARLNPGERAAVLPIQGLGLVWDFDGRLWFTSGFDRGAVFTFAPDGEVAEILRVPSGAPGKPRVSLNPLIQDTACMDARYFVSIASEYDAKTGMSRRVFLLNDRHAKTWETLVSPQPFHRVTDIKLAGGRMYFAFLHNPVIESAASGKYYSRDYENTGDPFRGVMSYDPAVRRYDLLVSSRRDPPQSPLDNPAGKYQQLIPISPDALVVSGFEAHVYNARTNEWRAGTPADAVQARVNRDKRLDDHLYAGGQWWRSVRMENGVIRFATRGAEIRLAAPWVTNPAITEKLNAYPELHRQYLDESSVTPIECVMTREGLFIRKGAVYHWVPRVQVEETLNSVLRQRQPAQNISKDSR